MLVGRFSELVLWSLNQLPLSGRVATWASWQLWPLALSFLIAFTL